MLKMASTLKESGLVRTAMESLPKVLRDVPGLSLSYLRPEHLPGGAKSRSFRTVQCLMGRASATPLFIEEPVVRIPSDVDQHSELMSITIPK